VHHQLFIAQSVVRWSFSFLYGISSAEKFKQVKERKEIPTEFPKRQK
jgi:hypothetical protein